MIKNYAALIPCENEFQIFHKDIQEISLVIQRRKRHVVERESGRVVVKHQT